MLKARHSAGAFDGSDRGRAGQAGLMNLLLASRMVPGSQSDPREPSLKTLGEDKPHPTRRRC
jgi:hypothetical protein